MERPKPVLVQELCKGCGRCISDCPLHAIHPGEEINQASGLIPVVIDFDVCNGCGLCISACPEPYGLTETGYVLEDPAHLFGAREREERRPQVVPDHRIPLARAEPLVIKGNY